MSTFITIPQKTYDTVMTNSEWIIMDGTTTICTATRLSEQDVDFVRIKQQFRQYGDNVFEAVHVYRVCNPELEKRYETMRIVMSLQSGIEPHQVVEKHGLYHSTKAPLATIVAEGLDVAKSKIGLFGTGLYCTPSPIKSSSYWPIRFNRRIMLEMSSLIGNAYICPPNTVCKALSCAPCGFDSVVGMINGQIETVVYNNAQLIPRFIIDYEVLPDYADVATRILFQPAHTNSSTATPSSATASPNVCCPSQSSVINSVV